MLLSRWAHSSPADIPPTVIVVTSIISTQIGATVAVRLFPHVGPGGAVYLRLAFAAIVLAIFWRPQTLRFGHESYVWSMLFGLTLAAMNYAFYVGISRVPLGIAVALEFVGPLGVAVAGSRNTLDVLWVLLAGTGIALLAPWGGMRIDPLGMLLVLTAGCLWGAYIILSRRIGRLFADTSGLLVALITAALVLTPVGVASAGTSLLNPTFLAAGLLVAVLSSVVTYSFELSALRRMATRTFGVLMSLEPAVAAVIGFVFLGQTLGLRAVIAIACVIVASIGATRASACQEPLAIDA